MLSDAQIEKFAATIKAVHPEFGNIQKPPRPPGGGWGAKVDIDQYYSLPFRSKRYGYFPDVLVAEKGTYGTGWPSLISFCANCGIGKWGELNGITYPLSKWDDVQKAVFALWLNDNYSPKFGSIFCSTATPNKTKFAPWEEFLFEAGFIPVTRNYNLNHGPNYGTVWKIDLAEDLMPKMELSDGRVFVPISCQAPTPPEVASPAIPVKKVVRRTIRKTVSRTPAILF